MARMRILALMCLLLAAPAALPDATALEDGARFAMSFSTNSASTGDPVTADLVGGPPGSWAQIFLIQINGLPIVQRMMLVRLSGAGAWQCDHVVPPMLASASFTFVAMARRAPGDVAVSIPATIQLSP